jgi:hypothetical protein
MPGAGVSPKMAGLRTSEVVYFTPARLSELGFLNFTTESLMNERTLAFFNWQI